ncbi:MAG TPA: hypothetical protein VK559_06995 [Ferruginibacter sp.]|nr:hypothetical protein [Ferruginibacter sp.]
MSNFPKKILLVQLFSNGDCLYATTVAKQIKNDFPGSHLTWAIATSCKSMIIDNPYVDEVIEVNIARNDVSAFRIFKKQVHQQKKDGQYDEVFITQIMDTNLAFYDGTIRGNTLKAYPHPITVSVQPVLVLKEEELAKAKQFAIDHNFSGYKNIILFEFAPQSGQSVITKDIAISIAEHLTNNKDTAIILSSANKITHPALSIIDGSILSIRETAALTHHCTFLLGTSSGITWISTSTGAKLLPMVQLLNPYTNWVNPISRDFERYKIPDDKVIELLHFDEPSIITCVNMAMNDFPEAKKQFNQPIPLHFTTTKQIVYNLICYLEFGAIIKHIQVNKAVYGNNRFFYGAVITGIVTAPFKLVKNIFLKRILVKK